MHKSILKLLAALLLLSGFTFAQFVGVSGTGAASGNVSLGSPVVSITTTSPLPAGTQNSAYSPVTLTAVGGSGTYTWSVSLGSVPAGMALSSAGVLSGTPTGSGTTSFSVIATDSNGVVSNPQQLSITIIASATLTIGNASFANPSFGGTYGQPISVSGGTGTGYVCSVAAGGTGLPTGITVSTNCAIGLTATNVGGTVGNTYTFKLHVVDSGSNSYTSPSLYSITVIQPCGPPNYSCAGLISGPSDNCILQLPGGGASTPGCPATNSVIPNLNNGNALCTPGVNCTGTVATDPQYNGIAMIRCTDGSLNGTITSGVHYRQSVDIGEGSSGDTNVFSTDSSLVSVIGGQGGQTYIETFDTTGLGCYPLLTSAASPLNNTPWSPGGGQFGASTPRSYFSFFPGNAYTVTKYVIPACATPGNASSPCYASASGAPTGTIVADFGTVNPGLTATTWAATTSYTYGQYVTVYLTNSQSTTVTAATCTGGIATYTISPALTTMQTGELFNVTGLSTFNGTALLAASVTSGSTIVTSNTGCTAGTATGTGTLREGSNVLFQDITSGTHTSGGSAPTWNTGGLLNTTDGPITWINAGTTNWSQGGGWTTIGGVSQDETQFSGGLSNNNFDKNAKGADNTSMTGGQNTGFLAYHYDSTGDKYYEWNTGSGIVKSYACTASSGPQCTRGAGGITVVGQVVVTSTTPCTTTPCQFYLHNVKIFKGGAWDIISPFNCSSQASGAGNCPATSKYFWQMAATTVNMSINGDSGHFTERFTHYINFGPAPNIGRIRTTTASNTYSAFWSNANVSYNFDGHWGSYWLNGSTDDTTITPIGGTTMDTYEFPYTSPLEAEVAVWATCGVASGVTTPACSGSELQSGFVAREGHTYATGTAAANFDGQFAIGAFSQDGKFIGVSTDYACQFGSTTGGTLYCGFPWSPSHSYASGAMIVPTSTSTFATTNPGNYSYTTSGSCTSGTVQPKPFNQTLGGTTTDGTCTWTTGPVQNQRADVVIFKLQ